MPGGNQSLFVCQRNILAGLNCGNGAALWATALPGKYAPESAGQILGETVDEMLRDFLGGMQKQYGKDE